MKITSRIPSKLPRNQIFSLR